MELINSNELLVKIKNTIHSGERVIIMVTKGLNDEIAETLLLKASKGIRVNVITSDTNWADWLESKKNSYGMDEIRNYLKEIELNNIKEKRYRLLEFLAPASIIVGTFAFGILVLGRAFWAPLIPAFLLTGFLIYFMSKSINKFTSQASLLKTMVSQRETEIEEIRKEIQKKLDVKINKKVGFTAIIVDGKGIITPLDFSSSKEDVLTFYEELDEKKIQEIFNKLGNSP